MTKESLKKQNDALKLRVKKLQLENKELHSIRREYVNIFGLMLGSNELDFFAGGDFATFNGVRVHCLNINSGDILNKRYECIRNDCEKIRNSNAFWERNHTQTKDIEIKYL